MKTTFYDIIKKERVGEYRTGYYTVDGKRPALPPDLVELEVIQDQQPPEQQNILLSTQWKADLENMLWRLVWTQTPKTKKTIDECLGEIENNYQARVDAGAVIGDVHLKMADSDRSAFTQLLTLLNEAERFGQLPTETTISDYNSNTITFDSGWIIAPAGLPATSIDNFTIFCNGLAIPKVDITSFTQDSGVTTMVVNESTLGYGFDNTDEIIAIGKFSS
jgi:hypothetical protein